MFLCEPILFEICWEWLYFKYCAAGNFYIVAKRFSHRPRSPQRTIYSVELTRVVACTGESLTNARLFCSSLFSLASWLGQLSNSRLSFRVTAHLMEDPLRSISLCDCGTRRLKPAWLSPASPCVSVVLGGQICAIVPLRPTNPLSLCEVHRRLVHRMFPRCGARPSLLLCCVTSSFDVPCLCVVYGLVHLETQH